MRRRLHDHRLFVVALALGAVVRVLVQVAFPPALIFSDGPSYLALVDSLTPGPNRPAGYGVLLRVLSWLTRDVAAGRALQPPLGPLPAGNALGASRRWGACGRGPAPRRPPAALCAQLRTPEHRSPR